MSNEQKSPTINEQGLVTLLHLSGCMFLFVPSCIGLFLIDNLSENAKNTLKSALNYQILITIIILGIPMLISLFAMSVAFWIVPLLVFINTIIGIANIAICIIAAISFYKTSSVKYPIFITFIQ